MTHDERYQALLEQTAASETYDLITRIDALLELAEIDLPPENKAAERINVARTLIADYNGVINNWF